MSHNRHLSHMLFAVQTHTHTHAFSLLQADPPTFVSVCDPCKLCVWSVCLCMVLAVCLFCARLGLTPCSDRQRLRSDPPPAERHRFKRIIRISHPGPLMTNTETQRHKDNAENTHRHTDTHTRRDRDSTRSHASAVSRACRSACRSDCLMTRVYLCACHCK
jgi:hypothetical protein